ARNSGTKGNVAPRIACARCADRPLWLEFHPDRSGAVVATTTDPDQRFDGAFRRDLAGVALSRLATLAHSSGDPGNGGLRDDRVDEAAPCAAEPAQRPRVPARPRDRGGLWHLCVARLAKSEKTRSRCRRGGQAGHPGRTNRDLRLRFARRRKQPDAGRLGLRLRSRLVLEPRCNDLLYFTGGGGG